MKFCLCDRSTKLSRPTACLHAHSFAALRPCCLLVINACGCRMKHLKALPVFARDHMIRHYGLRKRALQHLGLLVRSVEHYAPTVARCAAFAVISGVHREMEGDGNNGGGKGAPAAPGAAAGSGCCRLRGGRSGPPGR